MASVKDHLTWVTTLIRAPIARRKQWVKAIIDGIRSYRDVKAANPNLQKEVAYLSDVIQDDRTWELIGFSVNSTYVRADGPEDMLNCVYVHPWGTPALVYKHKKLPLFITVGPGIRWNESVLHEIPENEYRENVVGFTG